MAECTRGAHVTLTDVLGRVKDMVICGEPEPGDQFPIVWVCEPSVFDTEAEADRRVPWPLDDLLVDA